MFVMDSFDSPQAPPRRRAGRRLRVAAGLALAALLVGGGSVLGAQLAGGGAGQPARAELASNAAPASGQSAWMTMLGGNPQSVGSISMTAIPGGQARRAHLAAAVARIRQCFAYARQLRASGHLPAARATLRACLRGYLRLRIALLGAIHGQVTVTRPSGTKTIAFERGVIKTTSTNSIVVVASDGTTWTWQFVRVGQGGSGGTAVVQARRRVGTSALAANQQVLVLGPVVGGADDARLIVIRS